MGHVPCQCDCADNKLALHSVLTRPEHIQVVFKDSNKHFKAVDNNSGYLLSQILGQCVGLISQDEWRSVRAVAEKPFLRSTSTGYVSIIERRIQRHFDELWATKRLSEGLIDPADDLKLLPFWVVAEIVYGELSLEMEAQLRKLAPEREALFKHVIRGGLSRFHWSKYLPTEANRALSDFRSKWSAFNQHARDRAVSLGTNAPIVQMFEAVESGIISQEQLYHTLDEMLYANLDVTLGGISWNLVFLAAYKDAQSRLHAEISEKKNAAREQNTNLDQYLLSSSSFLAACISESSRLRPLAAFSVPQSAPTERIIGDYHFPAGTNFIIDSYALNIRNPYWGQDSEIYRPARFFERNATETRYNFWRFGFGPRQCMGKYVADLIIRVLLMHLIDNYELSLLKDEEWLRDPDTWINHPKTLLKCEQRKSA
jgi:cytochrome P450